MAHLIIHIMAHLIIHQLLMHHRLVYLTGIGEWV